MTDRELLELAAKAAGIPLTDLNIDIYGANAWNPLTDDGDALRLAVKLEMRVDCNDTHTTVYEGVTSEQRFSEQSDNDPYAATRRAIVRAAAEIGKGMK